ncbi:hypothetical protein H0H87_000450 [Tephrocybe sp. NHM501043]|nr:hypothetical protein H0H87_000450 [Tephrocybe sp. NHM501043]
MSTKQHMNNAAEIILSEALAKVRFPDGPSLIVYIPPEILEEIFQICAALPLTRGERPNRLAISQVCQQWRLITLDNPWIWGRIEVGSPKMAKELLARSEGAFLDVVCAADTRMIKVRGTDLQPHANRVRSFDISFRREYELGNLFSKIGDDFPNLASVSLNHLGYLDRLGNNPVVSKAPYSPRIERLELRGVAVEWISRLTDMTVLEIRGVGYRYSPSAQLLHTLLKASPRLEHLSLDRVHMTETPATPVLPVALPRLRIFYIEEVESVVFGVLPLISIPPNARVFLDFRTFSKSAPGDQENTRIFIEGDNIRLLRPSELDAYDSPGSARLKTQDEQLPSSYLAGLSNVLDLSKFTSLEINKSILSFLPTPFIVDFFNRLNVDTLRVGPNDREPSHYNPPRALAPGSYLPPSATPPGGPDAALDPDGSKSILSLALSRHQCSSGPLKRLDIRIPIPETIVETLRTLVSQVVTVG